MGDVSWLNEFIQMPNVELLLSEGIVLTNAYSHVSDTQSRASLFTGKYAWNLGLTSEVPNYDESGESLVKGLRLKIELDLSKTLNFSIYSGRVCLWYGTIS